MKKANIGTQNTIITYILIALIACLIGIIIYLIFKTESFVGDSTLKVGQTFDSTFDFKQKCYAKGGVLDQNLDNNNDTKYAGTLLECTAMSEFGLPTKELDSEIQSILKNIKEGKYKLKNEKDRLDLYFKLVYPKMEKVLTEPELIALWNSLELYYDLPYEIMPRTPIKRKRSASKAFYQIPKGITLDQIEDRPAETGAYIEVFHNGSNASLLRPYKLFGSTWYYPVKGSGIWIPTQNMLTANNKIHALKLLDVSNTEILKNIGNDFIGFLKDDSKASGNPLIKIDVVNKKSGLNPNTGDYNKKETIEYSPEILDFMINEISKGRNIRKGFRLVDNARKEIDIYYGLSDTGDRLLAQIARNRGYNNILLLKEPQMGGLSGNINVGCELMNLYEPIASQSLWLRLDPLKTYGYDYPKLQLNRYEDKKYIY